MISNCNVPFESRSSASPRASARTTVSTPPTLGAKKWLYRSNAIGGVLNSGRPEPSFFKEQSGLARCTTVDAVHEPCLRRQHMGFGMKHSMLTLRRQRDVLQFFTPMEKSISSESMRCVAVLGRQDEPIDAVEQYCQYLSSALVAEGISLELRRVRWAEIGWRRALRVLREGTLETRNAAWIFYARSKSDPRAEEQWGTLRRSVSRRRSIFRQQVCGPDAPRRTNPYDAASSVPGRPCGDDYTCGNNPVGPAERAKHRFHSGRRKFTFTGDGVEANNRSQNGFTGGGGFLSLWGWCPGRRGETDRRSCESCRGADRKVASGGFRAELGYRRQGVEGKVGGGARGSDGAWSVDGGAGRAGVGELRCDALCERATLNAAGQRNRRHILRLAHGGAGRMGDSGANYRSWSCVGASGSEGRSRTCSAPCALRRTLPGASGGTEQTSATTVFFLERYCGRVRRGNAKKARLKAIPGCYENRYAEQAAG